jgi:hypothetical protein
LEHPAATSLLPLTRISKSFVVNYRLNNLVGSINVNNSKLIKLKGNLAFPRKPSHPRGYCRGHSPPKNGPIFSQKTQFASALKYVLTLSLSESRRGAGSQEERTREPEIAYASARIRPFSLASDPAGCSRKSNSPNPNLPKQRKKQNSAINKKHYLNLQVLNTFQEFTCSFTRPHGTNANI